MKDKLTSIITMFIFFLIITTLVIPRKGTNNVPTAISALGALLSTSVGNIIGTHPAQSVNSSNNHPN